MAEQVPYTSNDPAPFSEQALALKAFAENPEPRCPCVLLLDVSGSMAGRPITQLNEGLQVYKDELAADGLAAKRVEVAVVTFGGHVQDLGEFQTADQFTAPTLTASGDTPMGSAINMAIDMVTQRKTQLRTAGLQFYRPWIFMITDGGPTDAWHEAASRVKDGESKKAFSFFAVGVAGANMEVLRQISMREPVALDGLKFRELFQWLSNSQQSVSRSTPGTDVPLKAPVGWAQV